MNVANRKKSRSRSRDPKSPKLRLSCPQTLRIPTPRFFFVRQHTHGGVLFTLEMSFVSSATGGAKEFTFKLKLEKTLDGRIGGQQLVPVVLIDALCPAILGEQ